jgi:hypothetical protein
MAPGEQHIRKPTLTVEQILAWADAHKARTGDWPKAQRQPVADAPGENWKAIDLALRRGTRGLPGGDTLIRLLRRGRVLLERRGSPNPEVVQVRRQMAFRWRAQGMTMTEIGHRLGVSRQAVQQMLRRAGEQRKSRLEEGTPLPPSRRVSAHVQRGHAAS